MLPEPPDVLAPIVAAFPLKRVLVLGDAILDEYLSGDCHRISPEAPVPVIRVSKVRRVLGGAANTAANVSALCGRATLVALVGRDDAGSTLASCASASGVDLHAVVSDAPTLRKTRVVGQQQQIVRLDYEEVRPLCEHTERRILAEDSKKYPGVGESYAGTKFGQAPEEFQRRERDVWKHADLIVCASTFAKRSLDYAEARR